MALNSSLLAPASGEDALVRVLFALLILVFGHIGVKLFDKFLRRIWISGKQGLSKKDIQERHEALQYLNYLLDGAIVIFALLYLNTGITAQVTTEFVEFLPRLVSAALVGILGIIAIDLSTKIGAELLEALGVKRYFQEIGLSGSALEVTAGLFKAFLYLLLLQIALGQLGIGETFIDQLVTASSWAAAFLVAGLLFYGFKDLFQNFAAGIYLKNSRLVRPGEEVRLEEDTGEIRNISLFSTTVDTDTGYTLLTPNREVMDSQVKFKRTKSDIDTLEDIKKHFVAQQPSYCGPASVEMALDILGYRYDQDEIGEKAGTTEEGTEPAELMAAVEELTEEDARAGFVEIEKITELGDELKAWFNDGAVVIPYFDKSQLFPEAEEGNYVLAVGMEGDEVLVIDPNRRMGGVYYVDQKDLYEAMDQLPDGGYMVIAPEGTTAHWRLKNELMYSEKTYYDELSKTLETRLRKILRQGRLLTKAMPEPLESYMENWRSGERVTRLWNPRGEEEDEAPDSS
ncbi:MAG: mechanosensitive ion channel domain-containing protein [Candidatus Nanohaloarchaea archaeon]